jgi:hypothetical protein
MSPFCIDTATSLHCWRRSSAGWLSPGPRAGLNAELVCVVRHGTNPPASTERGVPRSWVPSTSADLVRGGYKDVQHADSEPSQSFAWFRCSGGTGEPSSGTGRTIRPGTDVPRSVLVSDMDDGSLLLEAWRDGPSAYLSPADAVPLRRQLAAAFGGPSLIPSGSQGEVR